MGARGSASVDTHIGSSFLQYKRASFYEAEPMPVVTTAQTRAAQSEQASGVLTLRRLAQPRIGRAAVDARAKPARLAVGHETTV